MNARALAIAASAALAVLLMGPSAAFADQDAVVTDDTELHAQPKSSSEVVDEVEEDDVVTITKCQGNWCYVKHPGPDGWVRKMYLEPEDLGSGKEDCTFSFGPNGFKIDCGEGSIELGGPKPPASGQDLPYGPDTCKQGYVWREAIPNDHVCVAPASRTQAAQENAEAGLHVDPNGAYGPNSCKMGFVWREAYKGDVVCVTPVRRTQVHQENVDGPSHRVLP